MKKILSLLSEPRRKRIASAAVRNQAEFLNALGGNAQLHRWLRAQRTFQYFQSRYDLYADIQSKILGEESIDYLEFGVRYGDSIFKWSTINIHPNSRFIGFDSFEGIPEDWVSVTGEARKGSMSVEGVVPQTNDSRIRFVKGWFNDTLRPFLQEFSPRSRLVIHNDGDLFSSTLFTLATLDPILQRGSILIFDEFANPLHEWRAFHDYASAFGRTCRVLGAAGEYYTQVAMEIE
ncbi:MAG TPA: TylF/MycF/NovP-related O-methyltransferase [Candidatus Dormibacteraeota bacterium]|nr:TylF/MycF/NovP-related O-methyltransferase [Candidatus Dormibacteraeota bacterium]